MEKMAKPTEEHASTIEAYRAFDGAGVGFIHSKIIREIIIKSLDQVPMNEIIDMLDYSDLLQDRNVYYEGKFIFNFRTFSCQFKVVLWLFF